VDASDDRPERMDTRSRPSVGRAEREGGGEMIIGDFGCYLRPYLGPVETITLDWLIVCMEYGCGYVGEPFRGRTKELLP